jgi:hypothetical protein
MPRRGYVPKSHKRSPRPKVERVCEGCGKTVLVHQSRIEQQGFRFCTRACASLAATRTLPARVWAKVEKTPECWLWTGARSLTGYGLIGVGDAKTQRNRFAHRVVWELVNGPVPEGLYVRHLCNTRHCVNPAHLAVGTHAENMADMVASGRSKGGRRGGTFGWSKVISPEDAALVRYLYHRSGDTLTFAALAAVFRVDPQTIQTVLRDETEDAHPYAPVAHPVTPFRLLPRLEVTPPSVPTGGAAARGGAARGSPSSVPEGRGAPRPGGSARSARGAR